MARIGIIDDPKCDCLSDEQDLDHVLWNCPIFDKQLKNLIKNLTKNKIQPPYNHKSLFTECQINTLEVFANFLMIANQKSKPELYYVNGITL